MTTRTQKVELTEEQIVAATTNSPEMSPYEITLGSGDTTRTFKIIDLEYDDYMKFTLFLKPLFNEILSKAKKAREAGETGINFSIEDIDLDKVFSMFETTLPAMALIVLVNTDPTITVTDCKHLCRTPFKMLEVVLAQVAKNNIIEDFTSFFPQLAQLAP
jgi:hypothetical protein